MYLYLQIYRPNHDSCSFVMVKCSVLLTRAPMMIVGHISSMPILIFKKLAPVNTKHCNCSVLVRHRNHRFFKTGSKSNPLDLLWNDLIIDIWIFLVDAIQV